MTSARDGKVVTFYSYKGGTGRSMALAHAAWILASRGNRVLAIDWDLEAPGLHRYFAPFLADPRGEEREGLIDFLLNYCDAATTPATETDASQGIEWMERYAEIWRYAQPVPLPGIRCGGTLDFINAGRQDEMYGTRVALFDWQHFYGELGGGAFLNRMRNACVRAESSAIAANGPLSTGAEGALARTDALTRPRYDFVLIDSRTGLSDTSGICTAQLPDKLVCLFTYNVQSIVGASRILYAAVNARKKLQGPAGSGTPKDMTPGMSPTDELQVIPVPSRAELGNTPRLSKMREFAFPYFAEFFQANDATLSSYQCMIDVELPYVDTLSYNEVLSVLDEATDTKSYLGIMHHLTTRIAIDRGAGSSVSLDRNTAKTIWDQYQDILDSNYKRKNTTVDRLAFGATETIDQTLQTALLNDTDEGRLSIRRVLVALVSTRPEQAIDAGETFSPFALSEFRQPERDAAERLVRAGILCARFDSTVEGRVVSPASDDLLRSSSIVEEWLKTYSELNEWKRSINLSYLKVTQGESVSDSISRNSYESDLLLEGKYWAELTPREQRIWRVIRQARGNELARAEEVRRLGEEIRELKSGRAEDDRRASGEIAELKLAHAKELQRGRDEVVELQSARTTELKRIDYEITELKRKEDASARRHRRAVIVGILVAAALAIVGATAYVRQQTDYVAALKNENETRQKLERNDASAKAWEVARYGKFSEAKSRFAKLIAAYPDDPGYRIGRAYAQGRLMASGRTDGQDGGWRDAANDMEVAISLQEKNGEEVDPANYWQLAAWDEKAGDVEKAIEAYKSYIAAAKSSDNAESYGGQIKDALGRIEKLGVPASVVPSPKRLTK